MSLSERPKIVCLCGSTRFKAEYEGVSRDETLKGHIVLSVGMFGHQEGIDMGGPVKAMLDELHLRKVEMADEVLVVNGRINLHRGCGGVAQFFLHEGNRHHCQKCGQHFGPEEVTAPTSYIGDSTRREIEYARSLGKPVRYLEEPNG
jgi:hypothetical protein